MHKKDKSFRLLTMYQRLEKGQHLQKKSLADEFNVTDKTIQRDIDDLRSYLAESNSAEEAIITYDRSKNVYSLIRTDEKHFQSAEILSLLKILLESRAFNKKELKILLSKLIPLVPNEEQQSIHDLIIKEYFNYEELQHGKDLFKIIETLSQMILKQVTIEITYIRQDGKGTMHLIQPVTILFSEYYFYLIAYREGDTKDVPLIFRLDRIQKLKQTKRHFKIPYANKFNDGEFRKHVQFMYSGPLQRVTFEFSGPSLEAILDSIPTAKILDEKNGTYTIEAESYGDGIYMFLNVQGDHVRIK